MTEMVDAPMFEAKAEMLKAMAHPVRVRVLELLSGGEERSVSSLAAEIGIESASLSQQLRILRNGALVETRREATTVIYSAKDPILRDFLAVARQLLMSGLAHKRELLNDLESTEVAS